MRNWSDKEIDDLFLRSSQQYQIPYDPKQWEKVSERLDQVDKAYWWKRWTRWALILLLLLFSAGLTLFVMPSPWPNQTNRLVSNLLDASTVETDNTPSSEVVKKTDQATYSDQSEGVEVEKMRVTNNTKSTGSISNLSDQPPMNQGEVSNHHFSTFDGGGFDQRSLPEVDRTTVDPQSLSIDHQDIHFGGSVPGPIDFSFSSIANSTESAAQSNKMRQKAFNIGVTVAPDFSGVNFSGTERVGINYGLVFEYRLSRRFTLASGVINSRKFYETSEGYSPYPGAWNRVQQPDHVEAECAVIDIPLNIRYDFVADRKNKLFLATGFSSYLMRVEDYYFSYYNPSPEAIETVQARGENQHFFGVYNLSFGYERKLGDRTSIQVEPFLKLPLTGIGYGNVDLTSYGSFFTFKYRIR